MRGLSHQILYEIIFGLEKQNYSCGEGIIKYGDNADSLIFLIHGEIEIYTECEGNEFILERLHPGSIINYRTFFLEDLMYVNIRCSYHCKILRLTRNKFLAI